MERLTMWYDGNHAICENEECTSGDCPFADPICEQVQNIIDRLAAYEDTGLEPEEIIRNGMMFEDNKRYAGRVELKLKAYEKLGPIDRLRELAQADQEGKIPKYTIGDTIYDRFGDAWEVRTAELHLLGEKPDWMYRCGHAGTDDYCALWSFEILTREEAQAALRREQDEKGGDSE